MNSTEMDQVLSLLSTLTAEVASLEQQMLCIRSQIEGEYGSAPDLDDEPLNRRMTAIAM